MEEALDAVLDDQIDRRLHDAGAAPLDPRVLGRGDLGVSGGSGGGQ